jgi:hypothetical protein
MILRMTVEQTKDMIKTLCRIAKDMEDTAVGSSRVEMYKHLAKELRQEAATLEERLR